LFLFDKTNESQQIKYSE